MDLISWDQFQKVDLRVGKVVSAKKFEEARKPAYILEIDFGTALGIKKSSAQITDHYSCQELLGRLVIGVVNFPPKQIGPIMSECLVTGFEDEEGKVILASPAGEVPLGAKLA